MENNIITTSQFNQLKFVNSAYNNLPVEKGEPDNSQRKVRGSCFTVSKTSQKKNPQIAILSEQALKLIDIDAQKIKNEPESINIMAGNSNPKEGQVLAHCYCGFQFKNWAGQLGDGRAHLLGDIENQRNQLWELQLKGSGITPFSRFADGIAVLRSSVREFLCSEAMHHLGIPTTRAASLIVTDDLAERDKLYTGNIIKERCAVVMRLSPSFLRFGSFQVCLEMPGNPGPSVLLEKDIIPKLLDYTINFHYPEIWANYPDVKESQDFKEKKQMYLDFYKELVKRTAVMVAKWQSVGFVHGVLNTDNMSVLGLTIDYGPFEFIDHFTRNHVGNHSDKTGIYSYKQQPEACKWNLEKLAEALNPFIPIQESKTYLNQNFEKIFQEEYLRLFRNKLGFQNIEKDDTQIIEKLFDVMEENMSEFTNTFREFENIKIDEKFEKTLSENDQNIINQLVQLSPSKEYILSKKKPIASLDKLFNLQRLASINPMQLTMMGIDEEFLSNELQKGIAYEELKELEEEDLKVVFQENWQKWMIMYKQRLRKDFELESEKQKEIEEKQILTKFQQKREDILINSNPQIILRNYMAEEIIKSTEQGDYKPLEQIFEYLQNPFKKINRNSDQNQCQITPLWAKDLCISCSS